MNAAYAKLMTIARWDHDARVLIEEHKDDPTRIVHLLDPRTGGVQREVVRDRWDEAFYATFAFNPDTQTHQYDYTPVPPCSYCGGKAHPERDYCPNCGAPTEEYNGG